MKATLAILLAVALAIALAGCAEQKPEQTRPIKVTNPVEKAAPVAKPVAPPQATTPKTAPPPLPVARPAADGWKLLPSGVKYKDTKAGKGQTAYSGSQVTVHYKGWLDSGKVFDTSRKPGREPFIFVIDAGEVIPGWDQGVQGMKIGGKRELYIPSAMGYGAQGRGDIPPDATLHFNVELLKVEGP